MQFNARPGLGSAVDLRGRGALSFPAVAGQPEREREVLELLRARRLDPAATLALRTYGPELYGFLASQLGIDSDADEVFSQLAEDLWRGLPRFQWRCSLRTWLYLLARHAACRFRASPWNRGGRTGDSHLDEQIAEVHSRTGPWRRTDVKDRLRQLRDSLDPDDRLILVLRVDRGLAWSEVALVTLGEETPTAEALKRESARLRKRFQDLKKELRVRARRAGLLEADG
jgi:RNA polymerase sigma-70 factor (ECF subfamily)